MGDAVVRFGEFTFAPSSGELRRRGVPVPIEHQPALMLACLLARPGTLVSREELAGVIWRDGTHVKFDDGLNYCVRQVRAALRDDAKAPRFIETIPKRGYRFIAATSAIAERRSSGRWRPAMAAAALLLSIVALLESRPNNHHETVVMLAQVLHDAIF